MSKNEDKSIREMTVQNMIALCHLGDKFNTFNDNLVKYKLGKTIRDYYYDLLKLSKGEKIIGGKRIKEFYKDNKESIDIISKYSNIYYFLIFNYSDEGILEDDSDLVFFYNYIVEHKEEKENIVSLLNKIKDLGINRFKFDEADDFSDKTYKAYTSFSSNERMIYLDNMIGIANFDDEIIEYKTTGSNYKIEVKRYMDEISKYEKRITVNNLLFDPNSLPDGLSRNIIYESLLKLKEDQIDNCTLIQNSVNLSICVDDLFDEFKNASEIASKISSIKDKERLNEILKKLRKDLVEFRNFSESFDEKVTKNNTSISKEKLQNEKTKKVELRYWSNLDND